MKPIQLITILVISMVTGCTIPAEIELYNNSGVSITVEFDEKSFKINPNKEALFGGEHGSKFSVNMDDKVLYYEMGRLALSNIEFVGWGPFTKRVFRAQIESNGFIWAVGSEQSYPVSNFIEQPEGFPVEPKKV